MAPSVITIDPSSDFNIPATQAQKSTATSRTLLLAPPSIAAHPEALNKILEAHDRSSTDIQMLDRLALGLASLPSDTYDLVLLLTDADGTRAESQKLMGRDMMGRIFQALKAGGSLKSQDGSFGGSSMGQEETEGILAGLVSEESTGGMKKPEDTGVQSVPLRFGKAKASAMGGPNDTVPVNLNGKRKSVSQPTQPTGVGFVDFSDDLNTSFEVGDDDDLVDEDDLLTEEDKARTVIPPPECQPRAGKRRRACKDCTCGLKEKIEAEDAEKRNEADKALSTLKLGSDDLAEVDFTVQGKVGSCGNCALGDAFRCDGCPYIGMPAFAQGSEIRLTNDDIQL